MGLHTPLHSNIAPVCICISVVIFTIHAADNNCPVVECFVYKVVLMYNTDMFLMNTLQLKPTTSGPIALILPHEWPLHDAVINGTLARNLCITCVYFEEACPARRITGRSHGIH